MAIPSKRLDRSIHRLGPGLRRILGNVGWLMLDRAVRLGLNLVIGIWIARFLGPQLFGSLNFALAFVALFSAVTSLGLESIVIREVLAHPDDSSEILGTTLLLRLGGGLLGIAASLVTLRIIQPHDKQAQLLVGILSLNLLFQALDTIDCLFQSQVRSRITVWAKNLAFLVFAVVRITLLARKAPLWSFAAANTGEIALGAFGLVLGYRFSGGRLLSWRACRARAGSLLQQSWPVLVSGVAIIVYMRLDMVMLKVMRGDFEVGLYSAATRVSEVWYFVPTAIVSSVSPSILKVKHDPALLLARMRMLFSLMAMLACVLGSIIALASHAIVHLLYSPGYRAAGPILAVHVWASIFVFLGVAQSPWDLARDLFRLSLYRTLAGAAINIVLNLILIPTHGAMGAAIATVVAYAASSVFGNAFHPETRPVFRLQMLSFLPTRFWTLNH